MEPHGDVKTLWKKDVLYSMPLGPFNTEGVRDSIEKVMKSVNNRQHKQPNSMGKQLL